MIPDRRPDLVCSDARPTTLQIGESTIYVELLPCGKVRLLVWAGPGVMLGEPDREGNG